MMQCDNFQFLGVPETETNMCMVDFDGTVPKVVRGVKARVVFQRYYQWVSGERDGLVTDEKRIYTDKVLNPHLAALEEFFKTKYYNSSGLKVIKVML